MRHERVKALRLIVNYLDMHSCIRIELFRKLVKHSALILLNRRIGILPDAVPLLHDLEFCHIITSSFCSGTLTS